MISDLFKRIFDEKTLISDAEFAEAISEPAISPVPPKLTISAFKSIIGWAEDVTEDNLDACYVRRDSQAAQILELESRLAILHQQYIETNFVIGLLEPLHRQFVAGMDGKASDDLVGFDDGKPEMAIQAAAE